MVEVSWKKLQNGRPGLVKQSIYCMLHWGFCLLVFHCVSDAAESVAQQESVTD